MFSFIKLTSQSSIGGPVTLREACVALGPVGFVTSYPKGQVIVPVHRNLQGLRAVLRMPSISELCTPVGDIRLTGSFPR